MALHIIIDIISRYNIVQDNSQKMIWENWKAEYLMVAAWEGEGEQLSPH